MAVPTDHRIKLKECEKKDNYLDLAKELKKTMEHESDITILIGAFGTVTERLLKGTGGLGSWQPSGDHLKDSIIENEQNTEKFP